MYIVWPFRRSLSSLMHGSNCKSQLSHISVRPLKEFGALESCRGTGRFSFSYEDNMTNAVSSIVPDAAPGPTASQNAPVLFRSQILVF